MDKQEASITGKQDELVFYHRHPNRLSAAAFVLEGWTSAASQSCLRRHKHSYISFVKPACRSTDDNFIRYEKKHFGWIPTCSWRRGSNKRGKTAWQGRITAEERGMLQFLYSCKQVLVFLAHSANSSMASREHKSQYKLKPPEKVFKPRGRLGIDRLLRTHYSAFLCDTRSSWTFLLPWSATSLCPAEQMDPHSKVVLQQKLVPRWGSFQSCLATCWHKHC